MTALPTEAKIALATLLSYAIGCVCTGYYLVKIRTGKDIRALGSGSVGARNVGRLLGRPGFLITLLGDAAKGSLAVWLTQKLSADPWAASIAIVAVVLGHIYPAQLNLRGGRGVGPLLGALLAFDYRLLLAVGAATGLLFALARSFTLSGMIAIVLLPFGAWVLKAGHPTVIALAVAALPIVWAHRKRLSDILRRRRTHP